MNIDAANVDASVTHCLRNGTIRLLSCSWLRGLGASAAPLKRCQDLPDEAFLTPAELGILEKFHPVRNQ